MRSIHGQLSALLLLLLLPVLIPAQGTTPAATIYVAPTGDDGNTGSRDSPFLTWSRAATAARAARGKSTDARVSVVFRGGLYALDETVVLGPADSGSSAAHPITYESAPGERAVFRSGGPIDASTWRSLTEEDPGFSRIPPAARSEVRVASMGASVTPPRFILDDASGSVRVSSINNTNAISGLVRGRRT